MSHVDLNDRGRAGSYNRENNLAKKSEKLARGNFFCDARPVRERYTTITARARDITVFATRATRSLDKIASFSSLERP